MIYARNTNPAVNSSNTAMPRRNKELLHNKSSALYYSTAIVVGKEIGMGFLSRRSWDERGSFEVSSAPTPCWREGKEPHIQITGPELRFGARPRSDSENVRVFCRLLNL